MKSGDVFPSNTLSADDLMKDGKPAIWRVTIAKLSMTNFQGDKNEKQKRVIHFKETEKSMILNSTNWHTIEKITGLDDDDNWPGHKIELFRTMVEFKGDMVPAIRIRPVGGWEAATATEVVVPGNVADPDDVPF
jgi:hypothetical protein